MKTSFKSILFVFLLTYVNISESRSTVLFYHPEAFWTDYLSHIETSQKHINPIDFYQKTKPSSKDREELINSFEQAQIYYSQNMLLKAKSIYESIARQSLTADWTKIEREIILLSFIRLAHLETSQEMAHQWIERAISFDPNWSLPENEQGHWIEKAFAEKRMALEQKAILFTAPIKRGLVKINGRSYSVKETKDIPVFPGSHRVTLISYENLYFSKTVKQSELLQWKPQLKALPHSEVKDCNTPIQIKKTMNLDPQIHHSLFRSKNCIISFESKKKNIPLWADINKTFFSPTNGNQQAFYKKPKNWVWIGLSVIAAGWMYSSQQQKTIIVRRRNQ